MSRMPKEPCEDREMTGEAVYHFPNATRDQAKCPSAGAEIQEVIISGFLGLWSPGQCLKEQGDAEGHREHQWVKCSKSLCGQAHSRLGPGVIQPGWSSVDGSKAPAKFLNSLGELNPRLEL